MRRAKHAITTRRERFCALDVVARCSLPTFEEREQMFLIFFVLVVQAGRLQRFFERRKRPLDESEGLVPAWI